MNLKNAGMLFAVTLLFAVGANASPVTSSEASSVARAFVARGNTLGVTLGSQVEKAAELQTTNGASFFTVKMYGGGTLITTGDTDLDPIVAILPGDGDYSTIEPKSPLWALLNRDLSIRKDSLAAQDETPVVRRKLSASAPAARGKWEALLSEDEANFSVRRGFLAASIPNASDIDDLRVDPLVPTKWSQSGHGENYYTPKNYVCGCVATAMSQIMRYFQYPTGSVAAFTESCGVDGAPSQQTAKGGVYDWANMPPMGGSSQVQREAVGKLTYDCGVSVQMDWGSEGSGAVTHYVAAALRNRFGYANALYVNSVETSVAGLGRLMFACFDAGTPVQLGIRDSNNAGSGHSVVGDGYGFAGGLPYVHINMGWGGSADAWYNLPEIEYKATMGGGGYTADTVSTCVYNIFPKETGYILSGRVLDDEGNLSAGATVTVLSGGTVVKTVTASSRGVWAAILPPGTYDVEAKSEDGEMTGLLEGLVLSNSANSWGNDIIVSNPTVRIGENVYSSLNTAVAAAKDGDTLEILLPTAVKRACTIGVNCTIVATNEDAWASCVDVRKGPITIATGARVLLKNVIFTNKAAFTVQAGATLAVSGCVVPGPVTTSDATGLELAGVITEPISITAPVFEVATVFGTCSDLAAINSATNLLNALDDELWGGVSGTNLYWEVVPVLDEDAVTRIITTGTGSSQNFRSLRMMLNCLTNDAEVAVLKPTLLNTLGKIRTQVTFRGEGEGMITNGPNAGLTIESTGSLVITNLTLRDFKADRSYIEVLGGNLTLADGAQLENIASKRVKRGPLCMENGVIAVQDGATITNCQSLAGPGGGIHALRGTVNLTGGRIVDCRCVKSGGGGVYIESGYAELHVSGTPIIAGNILDADGTISTNDVFLTGGEYPLQVVGPLGVGARIGVQYYQMWGGNDLGETFAVLATEEPMSEVETNATLLAFVNSTDPSCVAAVSAEDSSKLVWAEGPGDTVSRDEAAVCVTTVEGDVRFYRNLETAFTNLTCDSTVELLCVSQQLVEVQQVRHAVVLRTADIVGGRGEVYREQAGKIEVLATGSLSVENLALLDYNGFLNAEGVYATEPLIEVIGGELALTNGAWIGLQLGSTHRAAAAVVIGADHNLKQPGLFTMNDGAEISCSSNIFVDIKESGSAVGGGLLVDDASSAYLRGGIITNCQAWAGGGVYICNEATVYLSDDFQLYDNTRLGGITNSNVMVAGSGFLELDAPLTGTRPLGITVDPSRDDTNLVARVSNFWTDPSVWSFDALTNSAWLLTNDLVPGMRGLALTNETDAIIVWCTGVQEDGTYVSPEGETYTLASSLSAAWGPVPEDPDPPTPPPAPEYAQPTPIAFTYILADTESDFVTVKFTNAVKWCNYAIYGTNTLAGGFETTSVEPVTNFQWTVDSDTAEIKLPKANNQFWKVTAAPGLIP